MPTPSTQHSLSIPSQFENIFGQHEEEESEESSDAEPSQDSRSCTGQSETKRKDAPIVRPKSTARRKRSVTFVLKTTDQLRFKQQKPRVI
jgi:hypothetical protein